MSDDRKPTERPEDRIEQFRAEVAELGVGVPSEDRERTLLVVGVALVVAGVLVVFAGWWGASGEGTIVEQFPYLISGGVLGLALVVAGAVLFARYSMTRFLRYWLIRLVYEHRAQTDRVVAELRREALEPPGDHGSDEPGPQGA